MKLTAPIFPISDKWLFEDAGTVGVFYLWGFSEAEGGFTCRGTYTAEQLVEQGYGRRAAC